MLQTNPSFNFCYFSLFLARKFSLVSGNFQYDILPGKPKESILYFRMNSKDPGIMMPELRRTMVHKEGVELIRRWIEEMK